MSQVQTSLSDLEVTQQPAGIKNSLVSFCIAVSLILGVFSVALLAKPDDRLPFELSVGEFGSSLPEAERFFEVTDLKTNEIVKFEKFPLTFKRNKKAPYAPAYRVALYYRDAVVDQRDLFPYQVAEDSGVIGFKLVKSGKEYTAIIEEMHGGDNYKAMSNPLTFTY